MTATNFDAALAFVWRRGFDSPLDGYHETPGDPGAGTYGGVIEATWDSAVRVGIVGGNRTLRFASQADLKAVLRTLFWEPACPLLPAGLDLLLFNGRMMSGRYPNLFQVALGLVGEDCDGWIGPATLKLAQSRHRETFIEALHGIHYNYLAGLQTWPRFGHGWTNRIQAARTLALSLAENPHVADPNA